MMVLAPASGYALATLQTGGVRLLPHAGSIAAAGRAAGGSAKRVLTDASRDILRVAPHCWRPQ